MGKHTHNLIYKIMNALRMPANSKKTQDTIDKPQAKRGFTLIEMIVSLGIFSIVILIAFSALFNILSIQRKSVAFANIQDNLRFALEVIAKNARTGTNYSCSGAGDCPSGGTSLSFIDFEGNNITYKFENGQIFKQFSSGSEFLPLTSEKVTVKDMKFYVLGTVSGDNIQPRVLITINAEANVKGEIAEFTLQTTVSQRVIDTS